MNISNALQAECITIITGPTGVGKSSFALDYAAMVDGEIINGDMGQMYQKVSIGTAKPLWQQEKIPHHLFDILTQPCQMTVAHYIELLLPCIENVISRGKTPVIVGGSLFYLKSLFYSPLNKKHVEENKKVTINQKISDLWSRLQSIDPLRAKAIHPNDHYRLERALELWDKNGTLPSEAKPRYHPLKKKCRIFYIKREREDLYKRIDERVIDMMLDGWIEEVRGLPTEWKNFLQKKNLFGYKEIIEYLALQGECPMLSMTKLISVIQKSTRNYAKRQESFWRMFKREILKDSSPDDVYVEEIFLTSSSK